MTRSMVFVSTVLGSYVFACPVFSGEAGGEAAPYIVDDVETERARDRPTVVKLRTAARLDGTEKELFDGYYNRYALARWTVPEEAASLDSYRREVSNELLNPRTGPVRDYLNELVLDFMQERVAKNYCPAFRVNAMLMIGELNAEVPEGYGAEPIPLPAALPVLLEGVRDPQQLDAVKVAALVGILRHLELGAVRSPDGRKEVSEMALSLARSSRPPGRSAEGHAWVRKQAADLLGALGEAGEDGAVATTLAEMVSDTASPFDTRCAAAEALGRLNYRGVSGLDASKLAAALGHLAVDACVAEAAAAKVPKTGGGGGGGGLITASQPIPGLGDGGGLVPETDDGQLVPIPIVFRNRLKYRVYAALAGLAGTEDLPGGIAVLAEGTPAEELVGTLRQHIEAILARIEENRGPDADKAAALEVMMEEIVREAEKIKALLPD